MSAHLVESRVAERIAFNIRDVPYDFKLNVLQPNINKPNQFVIHMVFDMKYVEDRDAKRRFMSSKEFWSGFVPRISDLFPEFFISEVSLTDCPDIEVLRSEFMFRCITKTNGGNTND